MTASRRYRNVLANPRVAPVKEIIRIHPRRVISWHLDPDNPDGASRRVD